MTPPANHIEQKTPEICIITGGLLSVDEKSIWNALKKQIKQYRQSQHHWLESKIKLVSAEPIVLSKWHKKNKTAEDYFSIKNESLRDLTEVVLVDEVSKQGFGYSSISCSDVILMNKTTAALIKKADVLFISSTLLHDLSELNTILTPLASFKKRIVIGGALAGSLYKYWEGDHRVDILAIGYGEYLVPVLASWIRSDYTQLGSPDDRVLESKKHTQFLFSPLPKDKSLDFIERPRWNNTLSNQSSVKKIAYESVRGCPYRCSFCNYPYLFNDKVFRTKSAEKIASDWEAYANEGVHHIVCLDSLFTMPKIRAEKLCQLLIQRGVKLTWTCYARPDDLADKDFVKLMYHAGARQFQIGIESGSQMILDAMNKKCTVELNQLAIQHCREVGITTVVSVIVGYPLETEETIHETLQFMNNARPDFHFLATFSVRVEDVPILHPQNALKYGLEKHQNEYTFAPYWKHKTMSCGTVGNYVRKMNEYLINNRISLDGSIFYSHIDHYQSSMKKDLLDFQFGCYHDHFLIRSAFNVANQYIDKKLNDDLIQIFKV
jgi:radical SAM superfamily enzyme YgiQ (UPF0313 family)